MSNEEFNITRGMLAQYKLEFHGMWYMHKPVNCFSFSYSLLLGGSPTRAIPTRYTYHMVKQPIIPKYVLHILDAFIIYHPTIPNIKTRYLKCFITIPEFNGRFVQTTESETKLGYVREEWIEPLKESDYKEDLNIKSKAFALEQLNKLRSKS